MSLCRIAPARTSLRNASSGMFTSEAPLSTMQWKVTTPSTDTGTTYTPASFVIGMAVLGGAPEAPAIVAADMTQRTPIRRGQPISIQPFVGNHSYPRPGYWQFEGAAFLPRRSGYSARRSLSGAGVII